ncbi:MAG TPA: hypothetical protein VLX92_07450 [Kofleriaceae bacterium]|nr:hypothetical protein [Kofleriaceae bacterium]
MANHPAAQPHGAIEELFPDVFVVRGSYRAGVGARFDRNMAVVRRGGELAIVNSVRLSGDGEATLGRLGTVKHVIRLGAFHGIDDPYYVERFGAMLWGPPGMSHKVPARELTATDRPLDAEVFRFERGQLAEGALVVPVAGGVLVTCDSFQNWTTYEHCSWLVRQIAPRMGFGPAVIGGPWLKKQGGQVMRDDFARLVELPFAHAIPGHGTPVRDDAKAKVRDAMRAKFS